MLAEVMGRRDIKVKPTGANLEFNCTMSCILRVVCRITACMTWTVDYANTSTVLVF